MHRKHSRPHSLSAITEQDLTAQKLFVGVCASLSGVALFHVAHEIDAAKWTSLLTVLGGLAYAARQGWKLTASRF
jgi:hypothetical protein